MSRNSLWSPGGSVAPTTPQFQTSGLVALTIPRFQTSGLMALTTQQYQTSGPMALTTQWFQTSGLMAPTTPQFQTSGLQSSKRVHFLMTLRYRSQYFTAVLWNYYMAHAPPHPQTPRKPHNVHSRIQYLCHCWGLWSATKLLRWPRLLHWVPSDPFQEISSQELKSYVKYREFRCQVNVTHHQSTESGLSDD